MENNNKREQCKLSFFGSVTAAATHEAKNSLAVMNESVGFIEDIIVMSEQGMPLDVETLKEQLNQISRQINRSDTIMSRLNWFAHSVDDRKEPFCVEELIHNFIDLILPLSRTKNIQLQSGAIDDSVSFPYRSFYLQNVIFNCLERTISTSEGNGTVTISCEKDTDKNARISITDSSSSNPENVKIELPLFGELIKELGGEFRVESHSDEQGVSVILLLPVK